MKPLILITNDDGVGLLNLNVPLGATTQTEVRWTQQSAQNYYQWTTQDRERDGSSPYTLRTDKVINERTLEPDSDVRFLAVDRVVSVAPLARNMTAIHALQGWRVTSPD